MIGLFDDDGTTRLGVTFNSLNLNSITRSSAGARSAEYGYTVETVQTRTAFDYVSEPNQWADLMEAYGLRKISRIIVLRGFVRARNISELHDKVKALAAATDASRIKFQNPTSWSEMPLTFSTPTEDTSNFASGLVASKYLGFPIRMSEPMFSVVDGLSARYELNLLLKESKRFYQTQTSVSGNATSSNSLADDRSWPTVTFSISGGAGSSSFTISNTGTYQGAVSLVLDLSGHTSGSWSINFRDRLIYKDGVVTAGVYKSGTWFEIEPGDNVIAYTNTTNTSSRVLTYYPAWTL